jgi:hypothetical protein
MKMMIISTIIIQVSIIASLNVFVNSSSSSTPRSLFDIDLTNRPNNHHNNDPHKNEPKQNPQMPSTSEEMDEYNIKKFLRMQEQRENAKEKMKEMIENPQNFMSDKAELMNEEQIENLRIKVMEEDPNLEKEEHRWLRTRNKYSNTNSKNSYSPYDANGLADPSQYYSSWAQAYRMLGAFISCDHGGVGYYGKKDLIFSTTIMDIIYNNFV